MRRVTIVVALLAALTGCGADEEEPVAAAAPETAVGAGVSVVVPDGWHVVRKPTGLSYPSDRLLLTSYRTRPGGSCGPERAARDLPARGAFIYLFEYRPSVGDPWAGLRRSDFPARPERFRLRRKALSTYECIFAPSYLIRFRAADRPFQAHVALGPRAGPDRRRQVLAALDSLRVEPLPAPPPDPYAGWGERITETGDSLRTPPEWTTGNTTSPRRYARPRALFFASNVRLAGLPPQRDRRPRRLPSPFPAQALESFPPEGVLLWVLEEAAGAHVPERGWPELRWEPIAHDLGRRFSVWVVSGATATTTDRDLAKKAAAALAVSGGTFRDSPCRRACRTG